MNTLRAYGVVQINGAFLGIEASSLMEAVHWPTNLQRHPVTRGALAGVFTLRGRPVPLVDLRPLLSDGIAEQAPTPLVAILKYNGGLLGVAIDGVCDIVKAADSQLCPLGPGGESSGLIPTLIMTADDSRLIYMLDLAFLASLPGVLFAADKAAGPVSLDALQAKSQLRHYLVFECDGQHFSIDASVVTELVDKPQIAPTDFGNGYCLGVTVIRDTKIPVLSLSQVLGFDCTNTHAKSQLLLLTATDGRVCGFGYDRMVAIERRDPQSLLPMPAYGLREPELLAGLMNLTEGLQAVLINHQALLERSGVKNYAALYQTQPQSSESRASKAKAVMRQACLLFKSPTQFVAPLSQVLEILSIPTQMIGLAQPENHLLGQFNLRGEQLPLVCLSSLIESLPQPHTPLSRVLVVRGDTLTFGFAVSQVEAIDSFNQFDPTMLDKGWQTNAGKVVSVNDRARSLVSIGSGANSWRATLMDLQGIARQLEARLLQPASAVA